MTTSRATAKQDAPTGSAGGAQGSSRDLVARMGARYGLLVVWALLIVVFAVLNTDVFLRPLTAQTIASTKAVVAILALAALVPLVVGQFDLSVASQFGLAQALCAGLIVKQGLPAGLALLVVLVVGGVFGVVNGLLVAVVRINAFVTTLATGTLAVGLTQLYTGGGQIIGRSPGPSPMPAGRARPGSRCRSCTSSSSSWRCGPCWSTRAGDGGRSPWAAIPARRCFPESTSGG